jgi:hypothetical protein
MGYLSQPNAMNINLLSTLQIHQFHRSIDNLVLMLNSRNMQTHSQFLLEELNWQLRTVTNESLLQLQWDNEVALMQVFQSR